MLSLPFSNLPTVEFVILATNSTVVNLARKKAAMLMMSKAPNAMEKEKIFAKVAKGAFLEQGNIANFQSKPSRQTY